MTADELRTIIAGGENERVEMTRAFDKADKIGQAVCAFANDFPDSGEAGILLLGVDNDGTIAGRRIEDQQLASLGGLKSDGNLFPPPSMSVEKMTFPEGDVVVLTVFPSKYPLLAEAMKVLGFVNKYNRGIAKVNRELEQNGNRPAQFDVNKKTEFRVTIIAKSLESGQIKGESGRINPESGQIMGESGRINPESGQIKGESGQINPESGQIKNVHSYDIKSQDDAVLRAIQDCPGIKADGIFLQVRTSTRSVRRSLERLSSASKIEYRGSKRTGGWYVRT